ncbi:2',3'-cyclic-nucleotide 3'-phosphodiesterase [Mastacembelus armatus]|uniref:2',3'-cyclic-nucleotide 3'-phosphodiesterase n=1 Tax=Mastacembelus armatus TaxID=205130 RepID=A0A3Q3SZ22_9TELE|nr:2',3'-cyclic-nucleotide 3'-phosphodiesterase [Mastacembelus armatus]
MDTDASANVLEAAEIPQKETAVEKEVVSKLETPEESTEAEEPRSADEEPEQLAVNGHSKEVVNLKETEESSVTENVTLTEKKTEMEIEDKEKSEAQSVPAAVAPPEPDESSEMICHPVSALETEPVNIQPVPENDPEPLPMQTPLAESSPEPEKLAESVPESKIQEQTSPEPATLQQSADAQVEKVLEQVETRPESQTTMDTEAKDVAKEGEANKDAAAKPTKEGEKAEQAEKSSEKPTEEKSASKEVDESAKAAAEGEGVQPEKSNAEIEKEEDTVPASGSLSFALLEREQTKDALRISRTLVILKGLPGSGKTFLARAIVDTYKDHCSVICADDHGVKPEDPESSAEGYKALDEAVVACCTAETASSVLIVVDDTNHTQDRLARLVEIAEEHQLVAVFLEPQTEWSKDLAKLTKKTKRGLEVAQLQAMKGPLEEMAIPLYFGWFLLSSVQVKVGCTSMDFLKTLDTLEAFKKHTSDFTGKEEMELDLEQYFETKGNLHCTTKFCDYGKAEGAKEYAEKQTVKDFYSSVFELSLSALFVTPRTVGARVSLTEEQLLLWPGDAEKEAESVVPAAASLPLGSRAHVTLGCAEGVDPVQTGLDLLEILALQQEGQQGELVEEMELGSLTYYGKGRWLLSLREPICAPACFSSYYKRKELEETKKEPEKKKKPKCTIL